MIKNEYQANPYSREEKALILDTAAKSIRYFWEHKKEMPVDPEDFPTALREKRATFVTLKKRTDLRGCIGSIVATRPLISDVAHNAYAAAFQDSRFLPLTPEEWSVLHLSVSILTEPVPFSFSNEESFYTQLVPGRDGLILRDGFRSATFLPSVWESLPEPRSFVYHLKRKAGIPEDKPMEKITVLRYYALEISPEDTEDV